MTVNRDWGYLLDGLCDEITGVSHALAVSGDGLRIARSRDLPTEQADQLSAFTSGLASLTNGASLLTNGGGVEQTIVEMVCGYLIVMGINESAILTVLADKNCDLGQVSYEMALLINRVGHVLTPAVRQPQLS